MRGKCHSSKVKPYLSYAKDSWDTIDGEHDVADFNSNHTNEEWGGFLHSVNNGEEAIAVELLRGAHDVL